MYLFIAILLTMVIIGCLLAYYGEDLSFKQIIWTKRILKLFIPMCIIMWGIYLSYVIKRNSYEADVTEKVKLFLDSVKDSVYNNLPIDKKLIGEFVVWRGSTFPTSDGRDYEAFTLVGYPIKEVALDSIKYLVTYYYKLFQSKEYNVHSYKQTPFGKQNPYNGVTSRTTYSIITQIFDLKSRQCIASLKFNPPELSDSYYNSNPKYEDYDSFKKWINDLFDVKSNTFY